MDKPKTIIGNNALITVAGIANIPAKIDTGADSSAIWASNINLRDDHTLEFTLFAPDSPLYTGEILTVEKFRIKQIRSSNGDIDVRYQVTLPAIVKGRHLSARFTLADRRANHFPVLIGRRTLQGKFLVDVSETEVPRPKGFNNGALTKEFKKDPQGFHKKHIES